VRIAHYCQHVLGIGHFHRSLEISRELASRHEVRLIVGGPPVAEEVPEAVGLESLPGLQMDADFRNLAPCDPGRKLDEVKAQRREQLFSFFTTFRPEVFLVELYPFGRKAFRFELDPVLEAVRKGGLPPCRCYVSLRDILVERPDDRDRFEQRAVTTANRYFDGLLIHADERIVTLEETFSRCGEITVPMAYTGFVSRRAAGQSRQQLRRQLQLRDTEKLIVVSIGGGNVGGELLTAAIEAFRLLNSRQTYRLQLFSGPYCSEETLQQLRQNLPDGAALDRFTDRFPDWLQAADLSISMAGYNTCMNIVDAGIPALVYPFRQNREQTFRATRLAKRASIGILTENDLSAGTLADKMRATANLPRYQTVINLDGATGSRLQIERWQRGE